MKNYRLFASLLFPALLCSCGLGGNLDLSVPSASSTIDPASLSGKVLFVGNSFTYYNDLPAIFASLGQDLGMDLTSGSVTKGSQKLIDTASSSNELGKVFDEALKTPYTHVILQEQSTLPVNNYSSFLSGVQACKAKIKAALPNAKIYLYSTWAYSNMTRNGESIPQAEQRIRAAYEECARETGLDIVYVGKAFSRVYENHPAIHLYHTDDKHPSYAGSYLAASTHLATIFGLDPRAISFHGSLNEEDASTLRTVAYEVANRLI